MADSAQLWERVLAAGQLLMEAQEEEGRLHVAYTAHPDNEALWRWRASRLEVDRLAAAYEAEMRIFRLTSRQESE